MRYEETIAYLFGLQQHGMKFGLDNTRRLMTALGDPQQAFRSVHVAGTNGKGSTCAMIESMLRTSGVTTGLFTSPHLVSFTERIRVNGEEISESDVIGLADEVRSVSARLDDFHPTFFEVVTAIGFLHFRRRGVRWAVVEVGMGGRLDATNIISPEVSVITPVNLDHREYLGSTLTEIGREKAGIIKHGRPVIASFQPPEVEAVLEQTARERGCRLFSLGRDFFFDQDPSHCTFSYRGKAAYDGLKPSLSGEHQFMNAATAIRAVEEIADAVSGLPCDIRRGVAEVSWPGRLELLKDSPTVLIDGAHNPAAAEVLAAELKKRTSSYDGIVLVMGVMGDKDIPGILAPLLPLASEIIFTAPSYGRSAPAARLQEIARELGFASRTVPVVADAVRAAETAARDGGLVVVTGSFYTIGEAKEALGKKGVLARLRE